MTAYDTPSLRRPLRALALRLAAWLDRQREYPLADVFWSAFDRLGERANKPKAYRVLSP